MIRTPHDRHRPRRTAYETSGTLSYQASSLPQLMQAERGLITERRSGMRVASTFRKLPTASPGARAKAASAAFTLVLSAAGAEGLNQPEKLCGGGGCGVRGLFVVG